MSFKIHVMVGGREVNAYELRDGQELVIGRDQTASVVVPDRSVSRRHCSVKIVPQGVEFSDLGSANGLFFNNKYLKRVVLREGEQVNLGTAQVTISRIKTHTGMIRNLNLEQTSASATSSDSSWSSVSAAGSGVIPLDEAKRRAEQPLTSSDSGNMTLSGMSARAEYKALQKERLALLVETAKSLGQSTELEPLLHRILAHLFDILPVQRAVVALTDDGLKFTARAVRPQTETEEMSRVASQSILRRVYENKRGEIIEDARHDQALKLNQSIMMQNIRAAICVPMLVNNKCLGAIYADYPGLDHLYRDSDLEFLTAFASIAGVSVENARMLDELRKNERLKKDLELAREVQQSILPNGPFEVEGLEIDWAYWQTEDVGGDFYDVLNLPDGRVAVVLGDVSGKSIPAALYMARTLSFLRATVTQVPTPGEVLTRVNSLLGTRDERAIFATCVLMFIDVEHGLMTWANAGHNPPLVRVPSTGLVTQLEEAGMPLGILDSTTYDTFEGRIAQGTWLTFFTDGLPEARDAAGREFGVGRVHETIASHLHEPVNVATAALVRGIEIHIQGSPHRRDDIAILNIRCQFTRRGD